MLVKKRALTQNPAQVKSFAITRLLGTRVTPPRRMINCKVFIVVFFRIKSKICFQKETWTCNIMLCRHSLQEIPGKLQLLMQATISLHFPTSQECTCAFRGNKLLLHHPSHFEPGASFFRSSFCVAESSNAFGVQGGAQTGNKRIEQTIVEQFNVLILNLICKRQKDISKKEEEKEVNLRKKKNQ